VEFGQGHARPVAQRASSPRVTKVMPIWAPTSSRIRGAGRRFLMLGEATSVSTMTRCTSGDVRVAHATEVGEELVELVVVEDAVTGEVVD